VLLSKREAAKINNIIIKYYGRCAAMACAKRRAHIIISGIVLIGVL
jgi:hypothetical protein